MDRGQPAEGGRVAAEAQAERAARRASGIRKHGPLVLRLVAPPELKGRSFPLGEEVTVGRAAGLPGHDRRHLRVAAARRVFLRDGQVFVEDLGSTNGTYLNRRKVTGPMQLQRGDKLQIGNTVLELSS